MEKKPLEHYQLNISKRGRYDMRETKEVSNDNIISERSVRDKCVERFEVLEKVKKLLLIPETEWATTKMIADYYDVSSQRVKDLYSQNKEEIDSDGTMLLKRDFFNGSLKNNTSVEQKQTSVTYTFEDGQILTINNRGLKVFNKRAILRIGMLLQQSLVAKEVRTQLLNIEEKTSDDVKIQDINEEQNLMLAIGMAMSNGDVDALAVASANLIAFKNRHIKELEFDNNKLTNDNKALANEILEWQDRSKFNAGIRRLKTFTSCTYAELWNELYANLKYKYSISLKQRGKSS